MILNLSRRQFIRLVRITIAVVIFTLSAYAFKSTIEANESAQSSSENIILVEDEANILTPDQRVNLENEMLSIIEGLDRDLAIAIYTTPNVNGLRDRDFGDPKFEQILDREGVEDGFYLLISVDPADRFYYIGTFGYVIDAMTDQRIENVLDDMYNPMVDGNYYSALNIGLARTESYIAQGPPSNQFRDEEKNLGASQIGLGLGASSIVAAIAAWISSSSHKRKIRGDYDAIEEKPVYNFSKEAIAEYSIFQDNIVNTRRVVTPIVRTTSSGGGGSSGRSTTHRTGGGRSSGGGGRKF